MYKHKSEIARWEERRVWDKNVTCATDDQTQLLRSDKEFTAKGIKPIPQNYSETKYTWMLKSDLKLNLKRSTYLHSHIQRPVKLLWDVLKKFQKCQLQDQEHETAVCYTFLWTFLCFMSFIFWLGGLPLKGTHKHRLGTGLTSTSLQKEVLCKGWYCDYEKGGKRRPKLNTVSHATGRLWVKQVKTCPFYGCNIRKVKSRCMWKQNVFL